MFRQTWAAATALLLLCGATWGRAEERIADFSVELAVQADASLLVTETITVNAEHEAIRHGIFRRVPTLARLDGRLRVFGAEPLEARLDGEPTPCRVERRDPLTTFILGDPDQDIARGERVFTLTYRATGHVRREGDGHVLHYDATGVWPFPIDAAAVLLTLPEGAETTASSASIARGGTRGEKAAALPDAPLFASGRPLDPGESLVVRAAWRGGNIAVPEPGPRERIGAHGPAIMTAAGVFPVLCLVLILARRRRADNRPAVRPLSAPPRDFPPGLAAHVAGLEENSARADLLWTAARGFLRMERRGGAWRFLPAWPAERARNARDAWQDEACLAIAHGLFSEHPDGPLPALADGMPRDWRPADADDGGRLFRALGDAQAAYRARMRTFVSPASWRLPLAGVATNALLLCAALYFVGWTGMDEGVRLEDHVLGIVCCSLIGALPLWWLRRKKGLWKNVVLLFFGALAALALGAQTDWNPMFWLPVLSGVFTPPLLWLLVPEVLTPEGREARAVVDGLALTLGAAPKEAARRESLLPYAAALGLDDSWARRLAPVFASAPSFPDEPKDDAGLFGRSTSRGSGDSDGYAAALAAAAAAYGAASRDADAGGDSSGGDGGGDGGGGDASGGGGGGGW